MEDEPMARSQNNTGTHPRYATKEAIEYCRSSRRSLERRLAEGKLTLYKNGFRVLFDLNGIEFLLPAVSVPDPRVRGRCQARLECPVIRCLTDARSTTPCS